MTLQEATEKAAAKNAQHPEFPNFYMAVWLGCKDTINGMISKGYGVLQREYTSVEQSKIACGMLAPVEPDDLI